MKTIEAVLSVDEQGLATLRLPPDIRPGEHRVVVMIDEMPEAGVPALPVHDVGPWPEGFTVRREEIYGDDGR